MLGDLHCHSKLSDGSMSIEDIVFYAKRCGLDVIALSDHDTMDGVAKAQELGKACGLEVIPAVELSSYDPSNDRTVHILCYFPKKPEKLEPLFKTMRRRRDEAGLTMIKRVMRQYPVTEEHVRRYSDQSTSIFKVHIMHALLDLGYDSKIYGDVYQGLFSRRSPYNVLEEVQYPTVWQVLDAVKEAEGIPVLAHPSVYDSMELLETLAAGKHIMGIEIDHPRNKPKDKVRMRELAEQHNLLITGGTDFHGYYTSGRAFPLATGLTHDDDMKKLYQAAESLR